jgi:hypothetical protein
MPKCANNRIKRKLKNIVPNVIINNFLNFMIINK